MSPQQESPSAEMVMLERLFLQAERYALAEDRRRARRDPGQCHSRIKEVPPPIIVTIIKKVCYVWVGVCQNADASAEVNLNRQGKNELVKQTY